MQYQGNDLTEIAEQINRDENDLLDYMKTGDTRGSESFVFAGFVFKKNMIDAAQMREPEY